MDTNGPEQFTGSARLDFAELTRAYRASHAFRGRLKVVSVLGAGSAIAFGMRFQLPWWQALSVLGLVLFSAWRLPSRLARGRLRQADTAVAQFRVDNEGLFESPPQRLVRWADTRAPRETKAAYVVDVPGELPFVLPKAAFDAAVTQHVGALINSRARPAPAVLARVTLALTAAVAVALVWYVAKAV